MMASRYCSTVLLSRLSGDAMEVCVWENTKVALVDRGGREQCTQKDIIGDGPVSRSKRAERQVSG